MAANNGKRMVKEDLLNYLEAVQTNYPDPSDIGGGGGSSYTAGTGIDITNDVISVDSTVVALKSDLSDYVTTSKLTTELSNYVTSTDLATELLDYAELSDLATVATTGSYNDLSNKPDLSDYAKLNDDTQNITANNITVTPGAGYIHTTYGPTTIAMSIPRTPGYTITIPTKDGTMALTSDIPSLTGYATESWVTNQGYSTFSGNYNDLTNKPTIPTSTSDLTNDSGFITSSALTGYATETWVTNQGYSIFSGSYNDLTNKPDLSVYETKAEAFSGDYNDLTNKPTIPVVPTNISAFTNDSGYITSSALTGYATESWVTNQGYSTFSGSYNDLTNKPTIPDAVSGTNDGTYWTSLTIGSDTYGLGGSTPANVVTTDTAQSISGVKTFVGNILAFKTDTNNTSGFKIYNTSDTEIGSLAVATTSLIPSILLSNASSNLVKAYIGFKIQPNGSSNNYDFVMPYTYNADFQSAGYSTIGETVFPFVFTDGTTKVKADGSGVVDLSTLNLGGSSYTAGTGIDITNDVISIDSTVVALKSDIPTVPTNVSSFTNDAGYVTAASVPTTATSTSTSTVTPSTIQLTFTFEDDTTQTVTLMTGATVSTTTTTTLS